MFLLITLIDGGHSIVLGPEEELMFVSCLTVISTIFRLLVPKIVEIKQVRYY